MDRIAIVGSSGHAKVVIDIVEREGRFAIAGLVDRYREAGESALGYRILGTEDDLPRLAEELHIAGAIVAIGDNFVRSQVVEQVRQLCPGLAFVTAIHPHATIGRDVSIGEGTVVAAGVVVNPCCTIGRHAILNTNASLDHDSTMGDFSSLAPRAATGGTCQIGDFAAIGIGAVLLHGISVGEHTVIGAGATVLRNVGPYCVAYGAPAREIRKRAAGDRYL